MPGDSIGQDYGVVRWCGQYWQIEICNVSAERRWESAQAEAVAWAMRGRAVARRNGHLMFCGYESEDGRQWASVAMAAVRLVEANHPIERAQWVYGDTELFDATTSTSVMVGLLVAKGPTLEDTKVERFVLYPM